MSRARTSWTTTQTTVVAFPGQHVSADLPGLLFFTSLFDKKINGEFVLRACLSNCVCCAVGGAVLAVVGALWLAWLLLSRSCCVDEAGVLEVSVKDKEAKQSERRGLCRVDDLVAMFLAPRHPGH